LISGFQFQSVSSMAEEYLLGVFSAIFSGVIWNLGMVLQKKVVNDRWLQGETTHQLKQLYRNPIWLFGVVLSLGIATIFFLFAQQLIGPALVPGLMSAGFILLIIGSAKIIKVKLNLQELIGIGLITLGIVLLGLSELDINLQNIDFTDESFFFRAIIFSFVLLLLWLSFFFSVKHTAKHRGIFKALSSALPLCISDFWISLVVAIVMKLFLGTNLNSFESLLLIFSIAVVIWANIQNIIETQTAFQYGNANVIIPVQQIPIQISPIFTFYFIFAMLSPKPTSLLFVLLGLMIIIASGFLLSHRQAEFETSTIKQEN